MNEFVVTINGKQRNLIYNENGKVLLDGKEFAVEINELNDNRYSMKIGNKFYNFSAQKINSDIINFSFNGKIFDVTVRSSIQEKANAISKAGSKQKHHSDVKSPMPGKIIKICKKIGDEVFLGDSLIILEAMKMENNIHSPATGRIRSISVEVGNTVDKGTILLEVE